MKKTVLESTVQDLCSTIETFKPETIWTDRKEEELLFEMTLCIAGSQQLFEVALAIATKIRNLGLPYLVLDGQGEETIQQRILTALSEPVSMVHNGKKRMIKPRFRNRISRLVAATLVSIYEDYPAIKKLLKNHETPQSARKHLVQCIHGFGPKQASLFLRRVGYSLELAILDVHVLDYMRYVHNVTISANELSTLQRYECAEQKFQEIVNGFNRPTGHVDLAIWTTMRVAKREGYL